MFGKRFKLFTVFGFTVWLDVSWFIIALLIAWSLAEGVFGRMDVLADEVALRWVMGAIGAVGLFASILFHELGHSLVARQYGMPMRGITLFIFGGVAEMNAEPPRAGAEFWVAIAGPIVSVFIALGCGGFYSWGKGDGWPAPVTALLGWLGAVNAIVVVFNLLPAFPLDGGRVLRSILWKAKGNLRWATKITSQVGSGFGIALIIVGVFSMIGGNVLGGIWQALIGMFLRGAAKMSYQQLMLRRALEGEPVRRFMADNPITVPAETTLDDVIENYVYRHHHKMYPVTRDGELSGCLTTRQIREIDRGRWSSTRAGDLADACDENNTVSPDTDAMQALSQMRQSENSRLMVTENGELVGIVALKDMLDLIDLKVDLDGRD